MYGLMKIRLRGKWMIAKLLTKSKVAISGLDTSPAEEILHNSSAPVELCFLHHEIVESMDENPSQKFSSDKERFPMKKALELLK